MNWKLLGPNAPETQKILASEQPFIPMRTPTPGAVKAALNQSGLPAVQFILDKLRQDIQDAHGSVLFCLQTPGLQGLGHAVQPQRPEVFFSFFNRPHAVSFHE